MKEGRKAVKQRELLDELEETSAATTGAGTDDDGTITLNVGLRRKSSVRVGAGLRRKGSVQVS